MSDRPRFFDDLAGVAGGAAFGRGFQRFFFLWKMSRKACETVRGKTFRSCVRVWWRGVLVFRVFFIELATRRVRLAGITTNPDGRWVTQQARNLLMQLDDDGVQPRFLIRGRDSKFSREFDEVFCSEGIRVIKAPVRAPKARAHAERWIGSAGRECLDRLLILNQQHLERILTCSSITTTGTGHIERCRSRQLSQAGQLRWSRHAARDGG